MKIYAVVVLICGILLIPVGWGIYKEKIDVIYSKNKEKLKIYKREEYAKRCSLSIFVLSVSMIISGIIGLIGKADNTLSFSVTALLIGVIISFVIFALAQSKYKSGLF